MKKINKTIKNSTKKFEKTIKKHPQNYKLKLFVTGSTPQSVRAINNIKNICDDYLEGVYALEVVDLYQKPNLASGEQIIAAPTLLKKLPLPLRRIIGDLSDTEQVLFGLDLLKVKKK